MHFACKYFAFGLKTNAATFSLSGFFPCDSLQFVWVLRFFSHYSMTFIGKSNEFRSCFVPVFVWVCVSGVCILHAFKVCISKFIKYITACCFFPPAAIRPTFHQFSQNAYRWTTPEMVALGWARKKKPATKKSILSLSSVAQLLGKLFFVWESAQPPKCVCIVPVNIFPFTIFISASLPKPELNEFQCLDRMFGATRVMRGCIGASHFSKL